MCVLSFFHLPPPPLPRYVASTTKHKAILKLVVTGNVGKEGFTPTPEVVIRWPGGGSIRPLGTGDGTSITIPSALTVGVVFDTSLMSPRHFQRLVMYATQAVKEVNADTHLIPNTRLVLDYEAVDSTGINATIRDALYKASHILIATRANKAGRPVAAFLPGASEVATVGLSIQNDPLMSTVPQIGVGTGSIALRDASKYPTFVRLFPPMYFSDQLYLKFALYNKWDTVAVFADKNDAYDIAVLTFLNGTGRLTDGSYTPPQITIAQAELVDMSTRDIDPVGLESTLTAMLARAKAMDIRIFHLSFNVETCVVFLRAMIRMGMVGSKNYQIHLARSSVQEALAQGTLPADVAAGESLPYQHSQFDSVHCFTVK